MSTERQKEEFETLRKAWHELYHHKLEGEAREEATIEVGHPKPALNALVVDILDECIATINQHVQNSEMDTDAARKFAAERFGMYARITAMRMFRLGQRLATTMPYESMSPCSCQTVDDEDWAALEAFLTNASLTSGNSLQGDGWVITNWQPYKQPERY